MNESLLTSTAAQNTNLPRKLRYRFPATGELLGLYTPAVLAALLVFLPLFYLLIRAAGVDSRIWERLFSPATLTILWNTIALAASVTCASIGLAVPLAWLTTRTDLPLRRLWAILTPLPLAVPSYIGAYLFVSAFGPRGLLQSALQNLAGIQRLPDLYGFPAALIVLTFLNFPLVLLTTRAALLQMDPFQEEAARSLGLSPWSTFWRVTFPQLKPALAAGGLLVALYVLRDFGAVTILRFNTFTRVIYLQYQSTFDRSAAALTSLLLVVLTLVLLWAEIRIRIKGRLSSTQSGRPLPVVRLGRWRAPAFIFCTLVITLALFVPAAILSIWLIRGFQAGETFVALWKAISNSVFASTLAAVFTLALALPVAYLHARQKNRLVRWIERSIYLAYALPGIVIALALVFFGANYARWLYQSLPLLILAYIILFLPQGVASLRSSLLQIDPRLEEAGRSLGKTTLGTLQKITFPLILPGIASGAGLVFLTAMKELPVTLILSPTGYITLASSIWSSVSEAFFARAALPALLLMLISAIPMAFLTHYDREKNV